MESKAQNLEDIRIKIHSIKNDGTDNTGDVANLSTVIIDPAGNELEGTTDYTEAVFNEIGATGEYECLFSSAAPTPVLTLIDQNNDYRVVLISSTADVGSSGENISIVSKRIWELATAAEVADIATEVARILGLVMENLVEDDIIRDANGNKTSSTIYIYDSAANATTHDKATGLVASYDIAASYTNNLMDLFKSIKA